MIIIEQKKIKIQLFSKILRVSEKYIVVALNDKRVIIQGENMCINYLEKSEIIILGKFLNIKFIYQGDEND